MMNELDELKGCPFCGGTDLTQSRYEPSFWHHWVECNTCEASVNVSGGTDKAIAAWNRRTPPSTVAVIDRRAPEAMTDEHENLMALADDYAQARVWDTVTNERDLLSDAIRAAIALSQTQKD